MLQECSPSPLPAHRTGRADFPHPALRLAWWQAVDVAPALRHMRGRSTPSVPSRVSQSPRPVASTRSSVISSTPGAPLLARAKSYAWRNMFARQTSRLPN